MATPRVPAADDTLSSDEAAEWLGIKRETLYAYASRGLVKGLPGARGLGRRYRREDLEPLRARSAGPAAGALRFGEPVLETRITEMTPQGARYRGRLVTDLVREGVGFEAVAELLWTGELPSAAVAWPGDGPLLRARDLARLLPPGSPPLAAAALALPVLAAADPLRFDAEPAAVLARARRLLPRLAASFALALAPARLAPAQETGDVAEALAIALGLKVTRSVRDALRVAMVLCADHELNASAFAARVAASTGADLYACLGAGVAAFSGPRHGGASEQVERLAAEAGLPQRVEAAVGDRLRRGERLPGFGHAFYADGDPRAAPLLLCAQALKPRSARVRTLLALAEAVPRGGRPPPNVDLGLAALCAALDLPVGLGPAIFAVGRSAGWVAHVVEQQRSTAVLRPRARYVGASPARD